MTPAKGYKNFVPPVVKINGFINSEKTLDAMTAYRDFVKCVTPPLQNGQSIGYTINDLF